MKNIIGKKYNRLTVIEKSKNYKYLCKCDCGNIKYYKGYDITHEIVKSCGCYHKEIVSKQSTKHGLSKHPLYKTWHNMRSRCNNPNATKYELYGGKGIKVCNEWNSKFVCFYEWSINNGWEKGLTIERLDSNKNYEPNNCIWANYKTQNNNTTQNHSITFDGKTMNLNQWAEYLNISKKMLSERIRRGWTIKRALTTPNIKKDGFNFGKYIRDFKGGGQ
jgi:hypothetical protein